MQQSPVRDLVGVGSIIVLANGPLLLVARKFFSLPGAWEDPMVRPVLVATVLASVAIVALDPARTSGRRMMTPNRVVFGAAVGLGGWAVASALWSVNPDPSLWRGLMYMGLPFVAWVIADLDDWRFSRVLAVAVGALVASSLVVVVAWESVGIDHRADWRGVFTNRNGLAPVAGLGVLLGVGIIGRGRTTVGLMLAAGSAAALWGSGSRTGLLATLIGLGVASVVVAARREMLRTGRRWPLVAAVVVLLAGFGLVAGAVARLWDDSTFIQRRTIWRELGDHIADAPLHGLGWDSFWSVPELRAGHELFSRGSAHNSPVELMLGVGVVGLVLWLVVVGAALWGSVSDAWRRPGAPSWTMLALTVFLTVENLTESFVLWFSYNWVLLIVLALRGARLRRPASEEMPLPNAMATG